MSEQQYQRTTGVLFGGLAIALFVSAVLDYQQHGLGAAGIKLVATAFLGYLSWRQFQPGQETTVPTTDERTRAAAQEAAATAFGLLVMVMVGESYFEVIPPGTETTVYMLLATIFLAIGWGWQKLSLQ